MAKKITWTNETRKLHELVPWPRNPRTIRNEQAERLAGSFEDFGQVETLAIGPDNDIYNGHQRLSVLAGEHGMDYEVDVRVSSRSLTEQERKRLTIYLHQGAAGEWDFEMLEEHFEVSDLLEWGFDEADLGIEEQGEETERSDGSMLDRLEVTIDEPRHTVEHGQVWRVGPHILICVEVVQEWSRWLPFLDDNDCLFFPYPGPLVPLTLKADEHRFVMVQPDPYIAGHIVDHYAEVHGVGSVTHD